MAGAMPALFAGMFSRRGGIACLHTAQAWHPDVCNFLFTIRLRRCSRRGREGARKKNFEFSIFIVQKGHRE